MRTSNSLPDISVIVVNYRSDAYLCSCLASLEYSLGDDVSREVILVNNDETEKLDETAKRFPWVSYVNHGNNIGFGPAGNIGAACAQGKILLFLNPDARVEKGFFSKLWEEFAQNAKLAIVGPGIYDLSGRIQEWSAGCEVNFWDLVKNNIGIPGSRKVWECPTKREVDWVSGAALAIRKDVFDELRGFDERFFMYFEDIDLCRRARMLGKKIYYCPKFSIRHAGGGSRIREKNRKQFYYASQEYYFEKYYGRVAAGIVKFLRKLFCK